MTITTFCIALFLIYFVTIIIYLVKKKTDIDFFSPYVGFPFLFSLYVFGGSLCAVNYDVSEFQWFLYVLSLVSYYSGLLISSKSIKKQPVVINKNSGFNNSFFVFKNTVIYHLFILFLVPYFFMWRSGIPLLSHNINVTRVEAVQNGYIGTIGLCIYMVGFLSIVKFFLLKEKGKINLWLLIVFFLVAVLSILTGSRTALIRYLFPIFVFYHYRYRKISVKVIALGGFFLFCFIAVLGFYRMYSHLGSDIFIGFNKKGITGIYVYISFAVYELTTGVEGLSRVLRAFSLGLDYQLGYLHISPFLMPLPGEQVSAGMYFKSIVGGDWDGFGMASTMLAPMYADFGVFGVFILSFILGIILFTLYFHMKKSGDLYYQMIYGVVSFFSYNAIRTNYLNFELIWFIIVLLMFRFISKDRQIGILV